jgi:hypothetical protein
MTRRTASLPRLPNAINRFHVAAWMPLNYNPGGSLDLRIEAASPGADKEANWLPAHARGPFRLTARIYWPAGPVLDGTCKLPPLTNIGESIGEKYGS